MHAEHDTIAQADIDRALIGFTSSSEAGQLVTLTVDDQLHALTVTEIGQVSFSDCCEMYTVCLPSLQV